MFTNGDLSMNTKNLFLFLLLLTLNLLGEQISPSSFRIFKEEYSDYIEEILKCDSLISDSLNHYSSEIMKPFISKHYAKYFEKKLKEGRKNTFRVIDTSDIYNSRFFLSLLDYVPVGNPRKRSNTKSRFCNKKFGPTSVENWNLYVANYISYNATFHWLEENRTEIIKRTRNVKWNSPLDSISILCNLTPLAVEVEETSEIFTDLSQWVQVRLGDTVVLSKIISEYVDLTDFHEIRRYLPILIQTQKSDALQVLVNSLNAPCKIKKSRFKKAKITRISDAIYFFKKMYSNNKEFMSIYKMNQLTHNASKTKSGRLQILNNFEKFIRTNLKNDFTFSDEIRELYINEIIAD